MSARRATIFPLMPDGSRSLTLLKRTTGAQADNNLIRLEEEREEALRRNGVNEFVFDSAEWPKKEAIDRSLDSRLVKRTGPERTSAEIPQRSNRHLHHSETLFAKESDWGYADTQSGGLGGLFGEREGKILANFQVTPRSVESGWTELEIQRAGFGNESGLPGKVVLVHEGRGARDSAGKLGTGRHLIKGGGGAVGGGRDGNKSHNVSMDGRSDDRLEQRRVRPRMMEAMPGGGRSAVAVMRPVGSSKDRHSKVNTAKGLRDRRVRLSAATAIQFFDVQDRLGYDQPSKAVDWLIKKARAAIDELAPVEGGYGGAAAVESGAEEWAAGRGCSEEGCGGLAEDRLEASGGKVWQEEMGGGGGGRAESRAKARERARERAKERFNSAVKAPPAPLDSSPPPLEAAHNPHLLPELLFLSQPVLFSDHSSTLLRPSSATQIPPPPPPPSNPLSPPDFAHLPPPPVSFLTLPSSSSTSPQLLHLPAHFFHFSAPSTPPPPNIFQDLPTPYDRHRPSSLHLYSSSSGAAASLPGPGPPPLPPSTIISTRGTLQSIFNPVSSLSQVHSLPIGPDAAHGCESGFHATSPTSRTSKISALHNSSVSGVPVRIHEMEDAEEETRMPSSSIYHQ